MADEAGELGFLTVLGAPRTGLVGGLLILNRLGRPVEFHCTAPLRPNRAQEILYGASLIPFLCGEQIAPALLRKAKAPLWALLTDTRTTLTLQNEIKTPLLLLLGEKTVNSENGANSVNSASDINGVNCINSADAAKGGESLPEDWRLFSRGKKRFAALASRLDDGRLPAALEGEFARYEKTIDLAEPFRRIALAIEESQKS